MSLAVAAVMNCDRRGEDLSPLDSDAQWGFEWAEMKRERQRQWFGYVIQINVNTE